MRRVIVIAAAGLSVAGCSSLPSMSLDSLKPAPPTVQVQLESVPQGADARTSLGPGCKTPCSVAVPVPDAGFSVTFTLPRFQPATVAVQVNHIPGDFTTPASTVVDPNPVVAELQPAGPPPKAVPHKMHRPKPKKPKPPKGAAAQPAASPFPDPARAPAPPPAAAPPPPAR